jgi:UDP-3-O-[3-hydroxymyristoyl] glucosamine N-acyltransferase
MPKLAELARLINADLVGKPNADVSSAAVRAATEGDVTLALDAAYVARVGESRATAVIVAKLRALLKPSRFRDPKLAFARAIEVLHRVAYEPNGVSGDLITGRGTVLGSDLSIHPRVTIGRDVTIGDRVTLHPGVVIGDSCSIGSDSVIYANVTIYRECIIGNRVIIHAGAVIGADGFGFVPDEAGRQVKFLQLGRVRVEDDCEIGANSAVDRGGFGDTVLRRGVKLDNLVQVGHNCDIGEDTVVAALAGFSGGTRVGRGCVIAGQVGTNNTTIGDGATLDRANGSDQECSRRRSYGRYACSGLQCLASFSGAILETSQDGDRLRRLEKIVEVLTRPSVNNAD